MLGVDNNFLRPDSYLVIANTPGKVPKTRKIWSKIKQHKWRALARRLLCFSGGSSSKVVGSQNEIPPVIILGFPFLNFPFASEPKFRIGWWRHISPILETHENTCTSDDGCRGLPARENSFTAWVARCRRRIKGFARQNLPTTHATEK